MTGPATSATMAQLFQNSCALSWCSTAPQLRNSVAIECGCAGCAPSRARLRAPLSPQLRSAGAALSLRHRCARHTIDDITLGHTQTAQPAPSMGSHRSAVPRHQPDAQRAPQAILRGKGREGGIELSCRAHAFITATTPSKSAPRLHLDRDYAEPARRAGLSAAHDEVRHAVGRTSILRTRLITLCFPKAGRKPTVKTHGRRGFSARSLSTPLFPASVSVGARRAGRSTIRCSWLSLKRPHRVPAGRKIPLSFPISCARRVSRWLFPQLIAAVCSKTAGRR
ncbi:hypothetical protein Bra1253DRAFT_00684 [Bradyrhizobium sp. WSM1253]|nr:hypothetical protein Bra1253DRAFT_00684 [Bradyrhizobium sp. WSM1253]